MSMERQEFASCENLDEKSNWKLITQLELEEDELEADNMEDADSQESVTAQAFQEKTSADRQEFSWAAIHLK